MAQNPSRYFIGDVYAAEVGIGFVVSDGSGSTADPVIDEKIARAIVAEAGGEPNAVLSPANVFEVEWEEFELFRDTAMSIPGLPKGFTIWQVKR